MEYCIVHYGEIGLKKANRGFFENILIENIRGKLGLDIKAKREFGLIILRSENTIDWRKLSNIPGIANYFICQARVDKEIEQIKAAACQTTENWHEGSFKVESSRHNKEFAFKSEELNRVLGDLIINRNGLRVDLTQPDLTLYLKITNDHAYLSTCRFQGIGGLPVGSMGRALCLLSGGIDSPVAAYMAIKRGLKLRFIHFKPKNAEKSRGEAKIRCLVEALSKYQSRSELIIIDFSKLQDILILNVPADYLMLVYRRFMIRIAEHYARYLVTGDNLGQVASQTLENLDSVYKASTGMILAPLMGFAKQEIIDISRTIGTYDISIQQYPDCCTYFVPKHPELKASKESLDLVESSLDIPALVKLGVESAEIAKI